MGPSFVKTVLSSTVPASPGFAQLSLHSLLLKTLAAEGYETPTPIQAQAIPPLCEGRDLLGIAQTGTGKTAAFALPLLHRLLGDLAGGKPAPRRRPTVLVLSPTRELAAQIGESFATYGRGSGLRGAVIFGGVGQNPQVQAIAAGIDVLVATPGRLLDLLGQGLVHLGEVRDFVLDEADRMLDMGFIEPIRRIAAALPARRRTMLFSATMPKEIEHLASQLLRDPVRVEVTPVATTVERIEQRLFPVAKGDKAALLVHLIREERIARSVVFTKTKHGADRVLKRLRTAGIAGEAIHGNKGQNQRIRALEAFRSGKVAILVATDVAARGLDVDGISHVFNFDLPMEPEAYVHRIGRTARAGASGVAISFCDRDERDLLRSIERLTRQEIPRFETPAGIPTLDLPAAASPAAGGGGRRDRKESRGGGGRQARGKRQGKGRSGAASRRESPAAPAPAIEARPSRGWKRPLRRGGDRVAVGAR